MASGQIIIDGSAKNVIASFLTDGVIQILYKPNIINLEDKIVFGLYAEKTFIAAKFELSDHQTLAHKEGGNWILNDPPPNKALELAKCQRYYQVFSSEDMRPIKAVDFRPPMRVNPALSTIEIGGATYYTADANL